jgi:hypothetical protein
MDGMKSFYHGRVSWAGKEILIKAVAQAIPPLRWVVLTYLKPYVTK